jgi:uncharacterized protein YfkK (UPF0435 family)
VDSLNLSNKSPENIEFMIEEIKNKLRVVNAAAIKPSHFNDEQYEDLKDIYDMVMRKNTFSISEMEAIVTELGSLRKSGE